MSAIDIATIDSAYKSARQVTQTHAKSFYFSSFPLPALKRKRAFAIYAYCRFCDDWIDNAIPGSRRRAREELSNFTTRLFAGDIDGSLPRWAAAFYDTVTSCHVPRKLCDDLIHGVCLDSGDKVLIDDFSRLKQYCYYVASVVGLLMNHVFEPKDMSKAEGPAIALGVAMQLTNILRDVHEDAKQGRVYLPLDELRDVGFMGDEFMDKMVFKTQKWKSYASFFANRAKTYYQEAEPGIELLPDDGSRYCVRCMMRIYGKILDVIKTADWDVSTRRYVPTWQKCWLALRSLR